jgi:hypothetical protein
MPALEPIHAPVEALTVNRWLMEIAGTPLASFSQVSGPTRQTSQVQRVDGGTGLVYKYPGQDLNFGQLTFQRQYDPGDPNDILIEQFFEESIDTGRKFDGTLTKLHFSSELFRFEFTGLLFTNEGHPPLNKQSATIYTVTYTAQCDYWQKVAI